MLEAMRVFLEQVQGYWIYLSVQVQVTDMAEAFSHLCILPYVFTPGWQFCKICWVAVLGKTHGLWWGEGWNWIINESKAELPCLHPLLFFVVFPPIKRGSLRTREGQPQAEHSILVRYQQSPSLEETHVCKSIRSWKSNNIYCLGPEFPWINQIGIKSSFTGRKNPSWTQANKMSVTRYCSVIETHIRIVFWEAKRNPQEWSPAGSHPGCCREQLSTLLWRLLLPIPPSYRLLLHQNLQCHSVNVLGSPLSAQIHPWVTQ